MDSVDLESSDLSASDHVESTSSKPESSIVEFFEGQTVFLTGSTGFLGKVLLEKLLRSCPGVKKVYALIRPKRGQDVKYRLDELLDSKAFDRVRDVPGVFDKVAAIPGDIIAGNLGISEEDSRILESEVTAIFHSAATIKFNEELSVSLQINVVGTNGLISLAKRMPNLKVFVHVSTAYANCDKSEILEQIYTPTIHPHKVVDALDWLGDDLNVLTEKLIRDHPNTYTFAKHLAEYVIQEEGAGLPVVIVRPSIVTASVSEPSQGWIDNFNGPTGLLAAIGTGMLRIMQGVPECTADCIPVDLVANCLINAAWFTGATRPQTHLVYNCTSGQLNRLDWRTLEQAYKLFLKYPLSKVVRYPKPRFTSSSWWFQVVSFFEQTIPCFLLDLGRRIIGKKPIFLTIQRKLDKNVATLDFFTSREWHFHNDNLLRLMDSQSDADKQLFPMDVREVAWDDYLENYVIGIKENVLKESMDTIGADRLKLARLRRIWMAIKWTAAFLAAYILTQRTMIIGHLQYIMFLYMKWLSFVLSLLVRGGNSFFSA